MTFKWPPTQIIPKYRLNNYILYTLVYKHGSWFNTTVLVHAQSISCGAVGETSLSQWPFRKWPPSVILNNQQ